MNGCDDGRYRNGMCIGIPMTSPRGPRKIPNRRRFFSLTRFYVAPAYRSSTGTVNDGCFRDTILYCIGYGKYLILGLI
jgi:hypothetical protein